MQQSVFQQVGQQLTEGDGVEGIEEAVRDVRFQQAVFLFEQRKERRRRFPGQTRKIDRIRWLVAAVFAFGQSAKLLDHTFHVSELLPYSFPVESAFAFSFLQKKSEYRQRRAQLVRRVGNETFFTLVCGGELPEHAVGGLGEFP